jgi:hypothetical protein
LLYIWWLFGLAHVGSLRRQGCSISFRTAAGVSCYYLAIISWNGAIGFDDECDFSLFCYLVTSLRVISFDLLSSLFMVKMLTDSVLKDLWWRLVAICEIFDQVCSSSIWRSCGFVIWSKIPFCFYHTCAIVSISFDFFSVRGTAV